MTKLKLLAAAAATLLGAVSANAAFTVTVPSTIAVPIPENDFNADLAALGLTRYASIGAGITLSVGSNVTFAFLGSESGVDDTFTAGAATFTQMPDANSFASPLVFANEFFSAGAFLAQFSSILSTANIGDEGFGIFLPGNLVGNTYTSNVLYFGYDNQVLGDDDNHDDLVISASVPEASTWLMLIMGFGLIGMRSRKTVVAA